VANSKAASRRFRRRLYWLPLGVIACNNAIFALVLSRYVSLVFALATSALLYFITLRRFSAQMRDQPRPRWITRGFDEPLFVHFGASTFALLVSPFSVLLSLLLVAFRGAAGPSGVVQFWLLEN
jgi:hypothetical protein